MSGLPAIARVWRAAWQALKGWTWLVVLLTSLALFVPLLDQVGADPQRVHRLGRAIIAVLGAAALVTAWSMASFNLLRQNHPHWAAVVPRHVATLRAALGVGAVAVTLIGGTLGAWGGWSFAAAALATLTMAVLVVCAHRWPWLWLVTLFPLWGLNWWLRGPGPVLAALFDEWPWAFGGTVLTLALLALRATVFSGGERHQRSQARLATVSAVMRGQALGGTQRAWGSLGWVSLPRLTTALHVARMRRLNAAPGSRAPARLALGLGPHAHWSGALSNVALSLLLVLAVLALGPLGLQQQLVHALLMGMLMGSAFVALALPGQLHSALWASRREQALLKLLPGAPAGAALNRWLALHLTRIHLGVVVLQTLVVLCVAAVAPWDSRFERTPPVVLGAMALMPLLALTLWRDWSRMRAPTNALHGGLIGLVVALGAAGLAWVAGLGLPWYGLLGVTAAIFMLCGLGLWRRLGRLPSAWPVGRDPRRRFSPLG